MDLISIQTQLAAAVKVQLDGAGQALRTLEAAEKRVDGIKSHLNDTIAMAQKSASLFDGPIVLSSSTDSSRQSRYPSEYALIRAVSRANQNFTAAKSIYLQLAAIDQDVERAFMLLQADWEGNMLLVAAIIYKLDTFRSGTVKMLSSTAGDQKQAAVLFTLKRYFTRIDELKLQFESKFWEEPKSLFSHLINKRHTLLVKIAKIASRMGEDGRVKMTSIFDDLVQAKFARFAGSNKEPVEETLKHLEFYLSDLLLLRDGLSTRFPPNMDMTKFFLLSYHRNIAGVVHGLVNRNTASEGSLRSGDILELLSWMSDYYKSIDENFHLSKEDLEPQLIDAIQEGHLIAKFADESSKKVSEWIGNLVRNEVSTFQSRRALPDIDADDRFYSVAVIDLCRIVKQTMETAAVAGRLVLLQRVSGETLRAVVELYVGSLQKAVEGEFSRPHQQQQSSNQPYLDEHVIAFANGALRWLAFSGELVEELNLAGDDVVMKHFKQANDAFLGFSKRCCDLLTVSVMRTCKPATSGLLQPGDYFKKPGSLVRTLEATLGDYLADWRLRCDPFLLGKITVDLVDRTVCAYFAAFTSAKVLSSKWREMVLADFEYLRTSLKRHVDSDQMEAKLTKTVDLACRLCNLVLNASPRVFQIDAVPVIKACPELQGNKLQLLSDWMSKRPSKEQGDDFQQAMDAVRKRWRDEQDAGSGLNLTSQPTFLRFLVLSQTTGTTKSK